jgi:hypothetical protein
MMPIQIIKHSMSSSTFRVKRPIWPPLILNRALTGESTIQRKSKLSLIIQKNEDSLYGESYEYDSENNIQKTPMIKEAAIQTAIQNAVSFSDLIAPSWVEEQRYYFVLDDYPDRQNR